MSTANLVSIVGAGHSGSTLLDMILGGHSHICSVGEISHWNQYLDSKQACSCGSQIDLCGFWKPIVKEWHNYLDTTKPAVSITDTRSNTVHGISNNLRYRCSLLLTLLFPIHKRREFMDALLPEYEQRAKNIQELYSRIREFSDEPIICDSSKAVYRFRLLHAHEPEKSKAIYLTRDGRAVVSSHFNREGQSIEASARRWQQANQYTRYMLRTLPEDAYIHVRYEELCREPEATLTRICTFLGCSYDSALLQFSGASKHNIGGNRMNLNGLFEIKEDVKWRNIMNKEQINTFEKIAGKTNRDLLGNYSDY